MRSLLQLCTELMQTIQDVPQVVIARVHALATAAGCQLVASCDLAVAAESAGFAAPGGKGGWFCHTPMVAIARNVGRKRAMELALTGDVIDAATALDWGLVNRVVPDDELDAAVDDLMAGRPAARGPARPGASRRCTPSSTGPSATPTPPRSRSWPRPARSPAPARAWRRSSRSAARSGRTDAEPAADRPFMPGYGVLPATEGSGLMPWAEAERRLTASHDYWCATVRPDGRPHVMPVWGVWLRRAAVVLQRPAVPQGPQPRRRAALHAHHRRRRRTRSSSTGSPGR